MRDAALLVCVRPHFANGGGQGQKGGYGNGKVSEGSGHQAGDPTGLGGQSASVRQNSCLDYVLACQCNNKAFHCTLVQVTIIN